MVPRHPRNEVPSPTRQEQVITKLEADPILSVNESAKRLGISPWTVRSYLSQGKLKRTKVGRRTMIRASQLDLLARAGEE